jgi:D-inositol-3-phosphate glycosyltransferase
MPTVIHVLRKLEPDAWGGIETHLVGIIPELRRLGWHSEVHAPEGPRTSGAPVEAVGATFRTFRAHVPYVAADRSRRDALVACGGSLVAPDELRQLVSHRRAALIHTHTLLRLGGVARLGARLSGIPYAATLHGPVRSGEAALASLTARRRGVIDLGAPFGWLVGSRRVVEDADLIFVVNATERDAWQKDRHGRHLELLRLGVSTARASEADRASARDFAGIGGAPFVALVGRLDPAKGQDLAIDAFVQGAPRGHHLVIAGAEMDASYAARLRAKAAGHEDRIHLVGNVAPARARALLAAAELALIPSRAEPFGLVLLEAWAEGTPALFSDVDGLAEIARIAGAPFGAFGGSSAPELAKRLCDMLGDPAALRREGDEGPARVAGSFGWARVAERLVDGYERAVFAGRRRAS